MQEQKISRKELKLRAKAMEQSRRRKDEAELYSLSQTKLMMMRFFRNKLAVFGMVVLILVYIMAAF